MPTVLLHKQKRIKESRESRAICSIGNEMAGTILVTKQPQPGE
jgi:hypothetical protein